jgi:hypothetical protein
MGFTMIFRRHGASEIDGRAGDVGVNVHAARENDHAGRVDRASTINVGDDATVGNANVLDNAVDVVRGIVDFSACYPKHEGTASSQEFGRS